MIYRAKKQFVCQYGFYLLSVVYKMVLSMKNEPNIFIKMITPHYCAECFLNFWECKVNICLLKHDIGEEKIGGNAE